MARSMSEQHASRLEQPRVRSATASGRRTGSERSATGRRRGRRRERDRRSPDVAVERHDTVEVAPPPPSKSRVQKNTDRPERVRAPGANEAIRLWPAPGISADHSSRRVDFEISSLAQMQPSHQRRLRLAADVRRLPSALRRLSLKTNRFSLMSRRRSARCRHSLPQPSDAWQECAEPRILKSARRDWDREQKRLHELNVAAVSDRPVESSGRGT